MNNVVSCRSSARQPIRAIAYARVSMAREETISPQIQMEAIQSYADRTGRVLVGEPIIEEGKSGRDFNRRIMEAIERIENGEAAEILVWKYNRFGRNTKDNAINAHRIEDAGGQLVSVTEEMDATTATGGFTRDILFALANMESKRIGEGWKEAQAVRLAAGLPHTATPRFGYVHHKCGSTPVTSAGWRIRHEKDRECRTDGTCKEEYRVDPVTGPVLAKMYEMYVGGTSLARIANWLMSEGVPTVKGGVWRSTTVGDLLDSGFGAGYIQVGVHRTGKRNSGPHKRDWKAGAHESVINEDTWTRFKARRARLRGDKSKERQKWPLSGITLCGHCGGGMTCTTGRKGPGYIMRCIVHQDNESCPGIWIVTAAVEAALFDALDHLADELEEAGRRVARTIRQQRTDSAAVRKRLERDLDKVETGRARLIDAVVAGALPLEAVAVKRAEFDAEEARITAALAQVGMPTRTWTPPQVRSIRTDWDRLPLDARTEMVLLLVKEIVVHPDKTIEVCLSPLLTGKAA